MGRSGHVGEDTFSDGAYLTKPNNLGVSRSERSAGDASRPTAVALIAILVPKPVQAYGTLDSCLANTAQNPTPVHHSLGPRRHKVYEWLVAAHRQPAAVRGGLGAVEGGGKVHDGRGGRHSLQDQLARAVLAIVLGRSGLSRGNGAAENGL